MASPSKLSASTQDALLSSLLPRPASSGSRSASSNLPSNQKADSAASSPSIKGKKCNRGDGDVTGEGTFGWETMLNSATKSVRAWALIVVLALNLMSYWVSSKAHRTSLPDTSGLWRNCLKGWSVITATV
ncbi:hypothetical protein LWI29_001170 [Acer saccharum]|uniref:Uncharacterized protein n=1 Tax=Acer saccharum TaxID=4024 RepID=A0AA39S6S1_ACESA|nr:hypothetical protein LWI29_001170 [Acer saccharum]